MHYLLKQIADAHAGSAELKIKHHFSEAKQFLMTEGFGCPMSTMDHIDCVSGGDASDRMEARRDFVMSSFYLTDCRSAHEQGVQNSRMTFTQIAQGCPKRKEGSACWAKLAAELSRER